MTRRVEPAVIPHSPPCAHRGLDLQTMVCVDCGRHCHIDLGPDD